VSAYVIVEIEVEDPDAYEEYRPLANASVVRHGGRFLVRGGKSEALEGAWLGKMVVLWFKDLDAVDSWYHSEDYQACLPIRLRTTRSRMIVVEGYEG
jgi:uncharacterized protein (DUF1330 family)